MENIKIKYYYKNEKNGHIVSHSYFIRDIEDGQGGEDFYNNYILIARCLYTGMKDKNGVEIYEGDIISQVSSEGEQIIHVTGYEKYEAKFVAYFKKNYNLDMAYCELYGAWVDKKEVIGNIYENPELLKGVI
jgi:uncharacterized phage protein (TIGR01671 family)